MKKSKKVVKQQKALWVALITFIVLTAMAIVISLQSSTLDNRSSAATASATCASYGAICLRGYSCPSGYTPKAGTCSTGLVCCKRVVPTPTPAKSPCQLAGGSCYTGSPNCPSGKTRISQACTPSYLICCK